MMIDQSPQPLPDLGLPTSQHTVRVRAIDTTTRMVCRSSAFVQPLMGGHEKLNFKTMCFLLEHNGPHGTEYVLFDCGARKDFWNVPPTTRKRFGAHIPSLEVDHGVDEILQAAGFDLNKLKAIVWSHWHWDHVGDGSKFPPSTDIVVGPGFKKNFVPGWPHSPDGVVLSRDIESHRVHEPEFPLTVAGFAAHDYFGDGSFFLLDVPGHAIGHICGFARTTATTFAFLGGDCCHFPGVLRPSPYLPLPHWIPAEQLDSYYPNPCHCSAFKVYHPNRDDPTRVQQRPFYEISRQVGSAYTFPDAAQLSIEGLQLLDASPDVFICLAHDGVLFDVLPLFNHDPSRDINDWQAQKYKERSLWGFLNEFPKGTQPGRPELVVGIRRNGKNVVLGEDLNFH